LLTVEGDPGGTVFRFSNVHPDQIDNSQRMITVIGLVSNYFGEELNQDGYSIVTLVQRVSRISNDSNELQFNHLDFITIHNT
ncbi:6112_t:CDS:1, partial [Ambispora leptoticha]